MTSVVGVWTRGAPARRAPYRSAMSTSPATTRRIHPAWPVAIVTILALFAAAGFRSTVGVLMQPLENEFGWSRATTSGAASLNLIVYGIAAPVTAAMMESWGVRRTVSISLVVVGLASAATCLMTDPWQLWTLWGIIIGVATGTMALTFGTIVANRWFVTHRGLVVGAFSASTAAGQVLFVPVIEAEVASWGWRVAALTVGGASLLTGLLCAVVLRDRPSAVGVFPYGHAGETPIVEADRPGRSPLHTALAALREGMRSWTFWALSLTFFVCGWSTNGIVITHLLPAAHDHSMPPGTAASIIALIGIFDVVGTMISGWLTDRFDPRLLLAIYYTTRGLSLFFVNGLLGPDLGASMWVFVVFYGLDWTATVPPTVELCRARFGLERSGVVFGWIYAAHMIGAGVGASVSGTLRQVQGTYALAWVVTAVLCLVAGALAMSMSRRLVTNPA